MRTFVVKLAAWHRLFNELEHARLWLAQVEAAQPPDQRIGEVQEDVRRLQRACDQALGELQIAADAYIAVGRAVSTPAERQPPMASRWGGDLRLLALSQRLLLSNPG